MYLIAAGLRQPEIVAILKSHGFTNLHLVKSEGANSTYRFLDYDSKKLKQNLGDFTVAGDGKVAVYEIPGVAKLGVSPVNRMVRFIDKTKDEEGQADDSHLAKIPVTPALSRAFMQAQASPGLRVQYCKKLWEYFNKTKFHLRMMPPVFAVSDTGPIKNARGVYTPGPIFGAGRIWMASFMFNAREEFFLEVFLHELCHQSAWCISQSMDNSDGGHGKVWKEWMVKVGLDPRRYDPTDAVEYKTGLERAQQESELVTRLGPRATNAEIKKLVPLGHTPGSNEVCTWVYQGRIFNGSFAGKVFTGVTNTKSPKHLTMKFKSVADHRFFKAHK